MKTNIVLMTVMSLALVAVAAPKEKKNARPTPIKETTPIARIESAVRNQPGRGEGIFGEFWWANRFLSRHQQIEAQKGKTVDLVLVGDSIIHFWEWKHPASWKQLAGNRTVLNLGYGGDRTENVIWRLTHGELDGYQAKTIVLMIGTNNNSSSDTKPENVALGVQKCVELIRAKQPQAKLVLHPIFPRGRSAQSKHHLAAQRRNEQTNRLLRDWAATRKDVTWVDFNAKLVDQSGWVPRGIMADEIHPTDAGYRIWSEALAPVLPPPSATAVASKPRPEDFACPVGERSRGHENIEWQIAYGFHLADAKSNLPRALLVGDSICNQHQSGTIKQLEGKLNVSYWISSYCVSSPAYLKYLAMQLDEVEKFDVVYFNNGLHSLGTDLAVYEKRYDAVLAFLKARLPKAKIIVVTSTMVADPGRCAKVKQMNEVVKRLAAKHGLQLDDLGALTDAMPRANLWRDGVHFGGGAVKAISDHAAKTLAGAMAK